MTRISSLGLLLSLALGAAACGTASEAAPPATTVKAQPASVTDEGKALCVDVFTRNRTCTDTYIPALVDMRAKYDKPPGIAEKVKADRDGIIAKAKTEWASDSTDEAIGATCTQLTASLTEADRGSLTAARDCLAQTDCAAFTGCIMPILEKRFGK